MDIRFKDLTNSISSFRTGDVIPVDGPEGTVKMPKDDLLKETAQNALAGNVAPAFDSTRTSENPYKAGESVVYEGKTYTFKVTHSGVWSDSDVLQIDFSNLLDRLKFIKNIIIDKFIYGTMVSTNGAYSTESTNRSTSRLVFVSAGSVCSLKCHGYDVRITFYSGTNLGTATILNETSPENATWNNGDFGIFCVAPENSVCAKITIRKHDNSVFSTDLPVADLKVVAKDKFVRAGHDGNLNIVASVKSVISNVISVVSKENPNKYYQHNYYVNVPVPPGLKARVLFGNNSLDDYSSVLALDWLTAKSSQLLPVGAVWCCVEYAYADDSDFSDMSKLKDVVIATSFNNFFGKRLSVLGDSISTFGGNVNDNPRYAQVGDPTYVGNRCRYPQTDLGLTDKNTTYWFRVIHSLDMVLGISESWAGSCISNTQETDSGDLGPNRCIASQTRIDHLAVNGTPDVILVFGGTNDIGRGFPIGTFDTTDVSNYSAAQIAAMPVDTFANAVKAMFTRLQKTYPNAVIYDIFPFRAGTMGNMDNYLEVLREACDFFGVQYIDMRTCGITWLNKAQYLPDNIHPNPKGHLLMAEAILKKMLFG
jgi:lysophospholipase L1-like esterase